MNEEQKERKRIRERERYWANVDAQRERSRRYAEAHRDEVRERNRNRYTADPVRANERHRNWREEHPEKRWASNVANGLVRRGFLERQPCEVCGNPKSEGHHDDYTKPDEVRWLCRAHHRKHHAAEADS